VEKPQIVGPVGIQRIMCPIDFSDTSRGALKHALAIAKWYESSITALHVIDLPILPEPPILFAEPGIETPTSERRQLLLEKLRGWLEPADRAGVKTEAIVDEGQPATRILDRASTLGTDLIVIGTHGLSGFERFVVGSVAEKVLRKAACPVMTVPPAAVSDAKVPYARLLCPVDFSEPSLEALRFAFSLAQESDARLTILHVFDWPADDELIVEQFEAPEFKALVESRARVRLEGLVSPEVRVWCRPETKVGYGKPYRHILATAEAEGTDLIVMGVRGRNALDLALLGSTTNHVVRRAPCPVLTLRLRAGR
jgi:nucleotide-binding universal stress UspA family protein